MAALQYLAPQFIQEKRLCWLKSPLYIVKNNGEEHYYFTDKEFNMVRNKIKGEVARNKGLGSLSPNQARNSMFNPQYQRLETIEPNDKGLQLLLNLMGSDVEPKKDFVFNNIDFSEVKE